MNVAAGSTDSIVLLLILGGLAQVAIASADSTVRLDITRDTSVSSVNGEQDGNNGAQSSLKTKSFQELAILDIDATALQGSVPAAVRLFLNARTEDLQRRVTVSTLASEWEEGKGSRYAIRPGAASFRWARQDEQNWTIGAPNITAVTLGSGNTIWGFAEASEPDSRGFQSIAVDPRVMAARVAGISHGFVVFDDVGSEYEKKGDQFVYHQFPNRTFWSREAGGQRAPYFEVVVGENDHEPPSEIESIDLASSDGAPAGGITLTWTTPADRGAAGTVGFLARFASGRRVHWETAEPVPQWLVPLAQEPGSAVSMDLAELDLPPGSHVELAIRPVDGAGNAAATTSIRFQVPGSRPPPILARSQPVFDQPAPAPRVGDVEVSVIDLLDKLEPTTDRLIPPNSKDYLSANHLWSAKHRQIRLYSARNEFVAFQLLLSGEADGLEIEIDFEPSGVDFPPVQWYQFASVRSGAKARGEFLPDPLIPLGAKRVTLSDKHRLEPQSQSLTSLVGEILVPREALSGEVIGRLGLRLGDQSEELEIRLRIWDFALPDHLSFIPQMNCYRLEGRPGSKLQLAYYRLAQEHRTCLNRLGYNWQGEVHDDLAPRQVNESFEFGPWDRRFGPLLDGSAFEDLPRGGIPVEAFYLPFNENWPREVDSAFLGGYWADRAMEPEYWRALERASREFYEHLRVRGWTDTFFEFYLNNKISYKKRRGSWEGSSALWIFDEPMHTQDFWALRQYGMAFHRGLWRARQAAGLSTATPGEPKMAFRVDVSRPQWQRDLLDGVVDVNVVSGKLRAYADRIRRRQERFGEILYNYGSPNPITEANTQPVAWALDVWTMGGDGIIPWQTMGGKGAWSKANKHAIFYPGKPIGRAEPVPSVRLKAFRRGQQDVEYLTILAAQAGLTRRELLATVRQVLGIAPGKTGEAAEGLGAEARRTLTALDLWRLRTLIGRHLDTLRPPDRERWIDLRTPARDPATWPHWQPIESPFRSEGTQARSPLDEAE